MKKIIIVAILIFSQYTLYGQNLINYDAWHWESQNGKNSFELYLDQNGPNNMIGYHCAVFYDGRKIDCVEDSDVCSVNLSLVSPNVYEGTITSGFGLKTGTIRISIDPAQDTLYFELLTEPDGEFYLPDNVYLEK